MRLTIFYLVTAICFLIGCTDDIKNDKKSQSVAEKNTSPIKQDGREGFAGVLDVPEMLCLSKMDSASIKDMPRKIQANYILLQEELERIGAVADGPAGQINYNNDPGNFKFECILLIREVPEKQPENCNIVVLEASRMLIYNYYGPYEKLYTAYGKIDEYCKKNNLTQTGPQREFYVTDPTAEMDMEKWLTRIMLPVTENNK